MSEANQYLLGSLERIGEQLDRNSVYAPALIVLANDQVPPEGQGYVDRILDGEGVFWDLPPLATESWKVYAALGGFYAQLLRLLCRDLMIDVWSGWRRSQWVSCDWHPLTRDFGWKIACRPLRGVVFRNERPEMPEATRYFASWPHGWLRLDECREYAPYLRQMLCDLAIDIGIEWDVEILDERLSRPEKLNRESRFELNNLCAGRSGRNVWQFQRGLALFETMRRAIKKEKDLISVGY